MEDRRFNEVDLRTMLAHARSHRRDTVEGRWVIESRRRRHPWEIIVEPDSERRLLVVVTAYPVWDE
jgi:ribosomal protein L34